MGRSKLERTGLRGRECRQCLGSVGPKPLCRGQFRHAGNQPASGVARAIAYPPFIAIESDGGPGYFIRLNGIPGPAYRLLRAPSLAGPWSASGPQTAWPFGLVQFSDPFPPSGRSFYRVVVQP